MFKRVSVVMLATNEKANKNKIIFRENRLLFQTKSESKNDRKWINSKTYELYFLSDEEIKEGDWILYHENKISQVFRINIDELKIETGGIWKSSCKKIIATTDVLGNLPQPSQLFIQKYIQEYNKGNIITDVLVEYEAVCTFIKTDAEDYSCYCGMRTINGDKPVSCLNNHEIKLKTNPKDNTITVKKVKDNWNRKEVIELLYKYQDDLGDNCPGIETEIEKWIKENI